MSKTHAFRNGEYQHRVSYCGLVDPKNLKMNLSGVSGITCKTCRKALIAQDKRARAFQEKYRRRFK